MNPEDEFEFEIDDEDDEPKRASPKKRNVKKGGGGEKSSAPAKKISTEKATRTPIPDGIKRRLALNIRDISKLKKEIKEYKDEKETVEHELEMLEDEIDSLRSEKDKIEDDINKQVALANAYEKKLNRNQKDFDNFRKRTNTEVDRKAKMGAKKIFMGLIDIIDNFDRAINETKKRSVSYELKTFIQGMDSIRRSLIKVLSENGIEMVDPIDEVFDPRYHEAIEMRRDTSVPEHTVIEVDSKGYILDDIVLRPAKVFVSKGGKPRPKKIKKKEDEPMENFEDEDEMDDIEEVGDIEEIDEIDELDTD